MAFADLAAAGAVLALAAFFSAANAPSTLASRRRPAKKAQGRRRKFGNRSAVMIETFYRNRRCGVDSVARFQLSRHGGDGFLFPLASGQQGAPAAVESILRRPGDFLEPARLVLLPTAQLLADFRRGKVALRRFGEDPAHVRVAAFGEGAFAHRFATGVPAGQPHFDKEWRYIVVNGKIRP